MSLEREAGQWQTTLLGGASVVRKPAVDSSSLIRVSMFDRMASWVGFVQTLWVANGQEKNWRKRTELRRWWLSSVKSVLRALAEPMGSNHGQIQEAIEVTQALAFVPRRKGAEVGRFAVLEVSAFQRTAAYWHLSTQTGYYM
ncbi:MAG: hypothetical protein Q9182_001718 [Xanthomendoza sp. 2 TL-2023]